MDSATALQLLSGAPRGVSLPKPPGRASEYVLCHRNSNCLSAR
jgi:hypothetical protein